MLHGKPRPHVVGIEHFAGSFLEAQRAGERRISDKTGSPSPMKTSTSHMFTGGCTPNLFPDKYASDRCLTKTLHIQNLGAKCGSVPNPSSPGDLSQLVAAPPADEWSTNSLPLRAVTVLQTNEDRTGSLQRGNTGFAAKRRIPSHKDIRRTQSEAQMDKAKKGSSGPGFGSLKRALSPFIFRGKKKESRQEAITSAEVRRISETGPIIMETGFSATCNSGLKSKPTTTDATVTGLVSPLVHPKSAINMPCVPRGSLILDEVILPESGKQARRRGPLKQNSSPSLLMSSQSSSLDSIKMKSTVPKPGTDSSSDSSSRPPSCNTPSPRSISKRIQSPQTAGSPRSIPRASPLSRTLDFSGDLTMVSESVVRPTAVKAVTVPIRKCSECNSIQVDKEPLPNKVIPLLTHVVPCFRPQ